jgi:hypothetical protein
MWTSLLLSKLARRSVSGSPKGQRGRVLMQKEITVIVLILVCLAVCLIISRFDKQTTAIEYVQPEYTHEEMAPLEVLYLLYEELGKTFECNDGRISKQGKEAIVFESNGNGQALG